MFEEYLQRIEQENNVSILYCCEAGSRAWGFPSPDSDYDIRFVYVPRIEWYLRLLPGRDTMEWFSDDRLLDFSGWELRKTLNLFAVCNPAFNEQLGSPIVYREEAVFAKTLRNRLAAYFHPVKAFHHYFSIADKMAAAHPFTEPIGVKAYFYIIRPLLACRFILNHSVQPPTLFSELLEQVDLPKEIQNLLTELVERKKTTDEKAAVAVPSDLILYTRQLHEEMSALRLDGLNRLLDSAQSPDRQPLETLFQHFTLPTS